MPASRPHLILIGGFLGAGKTTALIALAGWLADQGLRAAFITNDQGRDLVDTRLLRACGLATEEIAGGCFCCRFDDLVGATRRMRGVLPPDVYVAEAVGSCTDLAATVAYPMRRLLADECTVAPLSVLVDPIRARSAFGLDAGDIFSDDVQYIYRKQLEEADLIVISKCDLLAAGDITALRTALQREFPAADVHAVSSQAGINTDRWFRRIVLGEQEPRTAMAVDYDRYAAGEARLGWLNARIDVSSPEASDGDELIRRLASEFQRRLGEAGAAVAHLKMTLQAGDDLASIQLTHGAGVPRAGQRLVRSITSGSLTVNLRAESRPELLEQVLRASLAAITGWRLAVQQVESFRPGRPMPTHRDAGQGTP